MPEQITKSPSQLIANMFNKFTELSIKIAELFASLSDEQLREIRAELQNGSITLIYQLFASDPYLREISALIFSLESTDYLAFPLFRILYSKIINLAETMIARVRTTLSSQVNSQMVISDLAQQLNYLIKNENSPEACFLQLIDLFKYIQPLNDTYSPDMQQASDSTAVQDDNCACEQCLFNDQYQAQKKTAVQDDNCACEQCLFNYQAQGQTAMLQQASASADDEPPPLPSLHRS